MTEYALEVWGPNLPTRNEQIHVHAKGCADTKRGMYRTAESPWLASFESEREVVEGVYPPEEFGYDADKEWQDFAGDVKFFPCCDDLPREAPATTS